MLAGRVESQQLRLALGPTADRGPRLDLGAGADLAVRRDHHQPVHGQVDQLQLLSAVLVDLLRGDVGQGGAVDLAGALLSDPEPIADLGERQPLMTSTRRAAAVGVILLRGGMK